MSQELIHIKCPRALTVAPEEIAAMREAFAMNIGDGSVSEFDPPRTKVNPGGGGQACKQVKHLFIRAVRLLVGRAPPASGRDREGDRPGPRCLDRHDPGGALGEERRGHCPGDGGRPGSSHRH